MIVERIIKYENMIGKAGNHPEWMLSVDFKKVVREKAQCICSKSVAMPCGSILWVDFGIVLSPGCENFEAGLHPFMF
jgi:hypothetical protein